MAVHGRARGSLPVALVLLLAACSPTATVTSPPPEASAPAASSAVASGSPAGEPVTLEYFSALNETEPYVAGYKQIIESYQQLNPNVTINVSWMGRSLSTKIKPLLQAGNLPDIVENDLGNVYSTLVKEGLIADLGPFYDQPGYGVETPWKESWSEGSLESLSATGQLNTVPFWVDATQIFYDERLFIEHGLSVPGTWDELMEICATLKSKDIACFGQENADPYYWGILILRLLGPDALVTAIGDTTGEAWLQPEFLSAAEKIYSLKANGYFREGFEGSQYPAAQIGWVNGESALYLLPDWLPSELTDAVPEGFIFRSFPFPTVDGKGSTTDVELYQWGFAVMKDSPNQAAAVDFIKYFTSPDVFKPLQTEYSIVSAIKTPWEPKNNADSQKNIAEATSITNLGGASYVYPDFGREVSGPLLTDLLFNKITPEEFIQKLSEGTVAFWKTQ